MQPALSVAVAEKLAALHSAAFPGERGWSAAEIAALAASGILITEPDHAGFALIRVAADEAELLTLAVDPAERRRGIGAALLREGEAAAYAAGAATLFLEVAADNAAARALYERAGYEEKGLRRGYYQRGSNSVDALLLARALSLPSAD